MAAEELKVHTSQNRNKTSYIIPASSLLPRIEDGISIEVIPLAATNWRRYWHRGHTSCYYEFETIVSLLLSRIGEDISNEVVHLAVTDRRRHHKKGHRGYISCYYESEIVTSLLLPRIEGDIVRNGIELTATDRIGYVYRIYLLLPDHSKKSSNLPQCRKLDF